MTQLPGTRGNAGLAFAAAAGLGFALWALAPWLVNRREPWDAEGPFYSLSLVLGTGAIAWWQPSRLAAAYLGAWLGQVLALVVLPGHQDGWLPLGAVTTGFGSLFALVGAALGSALGRAWPPSSGGAA
jgi:hypothetical protein